MSSNPVIAPPSFPEQLLRTPMVNQGGLCTYLWTKFFQSLPFNLKTQQLTKLSDGSGNDRNPTYSSDGRWIAFYSFRDGPNSVLYIMDPDGSNPTAVSNAQISAVNHSWSPDASLIACAAAG